MAPRWFKNINFGRDLTNIHNNEIIENFRSAFEKKVDQITFDSTGPIIEEVDSDGEYSGPHQIDVGRASSIHSRHKSFQLEDRRRSEELGDDISRNRSIERQEDLLEDEDIPDNFLQHEDLAEELLEDEDRAEEPLEDVDIADDDISDVSNGLPHFPQQSPEDFQEHSSDNSSDNLSDLSDDESDYIQARSSRQSPKNLPQVTPQEDLDELSSNFAPKSLRQSPAKTSSVTPARTPARTPATTPARTPARTPLRIPARTPARTSSVTLSSKSAITSASSSDHTLADIQVDTPANILPETPANILLETPVDILPETPSDISSETPVDILPGSPAVTPEERQKELPNATSRVIRPVTQKPRNESESHLRRSDRIRLPPLDFARGEKAVYKRKGPTFEIAGVLEAFPPNKYGKKNANQPPKFKIPKDIIQAEPINFKKSKKGDYKLFLHKVSDKLHLGFIHLDVGKVKPNAPSSYDSVYTFRVERGTVIFTTIKNGKRENILLNSKTNVFILPQAARYIIKNCGNTPADLMYILSRR